jgi:hypothetical protein
MSLNYEMKELLAVGEEMLTLELDRIGTLLGWGV